MGLTLLQRIFISFTPMHHLTEWVQSKLGTTTMKYPHMIVYDGNWLRRKKQQTLSQKITKVNFWKPENNILESKRSLQSTREVKAGLQEH